MLKGDYSSGQLLALIEHFAFAVGMRLHFLIFASLQNVPFVGAALRAQGRGLPRGPQDRDAALAQVSAGRLIAYIDHAWDRRRLLQARIGRALPALRERALADQRDRGPAARASRWPARRGAA